VTRRILGSACPPFEVGSGMISYCMKNTAILWTTQEKVQKPPPTARVRRPDDAP
jgi:hypothetical protein